MVCHLSSVIANCQLSNGFPDPGMLMNGALCYREALIEAFDKAN